MTCRRGPHCTAKDAQGNPAPADRPLCIRDEDELDRALRDSPRQLTDLRVAMLAALPGRGLTEPTAGGNVEAPLPYRDDLDELADDLVGTTIEWATVVAELAGVDPPPPGRHYPGNALQVAVRILRGRLSVLLALQPRAVQRGDDTLTMDGGDAALELLYLQHRVKTVLGTTRKMLHLPEPCPGCGVKLTLCHHPGRTDVRCTACGTHYRLGDVQPAEEETA